MATLNLLFDGKSFPVPKKCLFTLLDEHQELFSATSYAVQSSVPLDVFERFVNSLKTHSKISVTKGNVVSLWSLASEFFLSDVTAECERLSVPVGQFAALCDRVSELERGISSSSKRPGRIEEHIVSQEEALESLRLTVEKLGISVERELNELKSGMEPKSKPLSGSSKPSFSQSCPPKREKVRSKFEIPLKQARSLEGVISYLTKKHGGNVHEKEIVIITSKSVHHNPKFCLKRITDLTVASNFCSQDDPGQWVRWDFGEMRLRPTHYTVKADYLKSWVVEGSVDGKNWAEIDRQTDNQDFKDASTSIAVSFAVRVSREFRFIRLTQIDENHWGGDQLVLYGVEFFGALSE
jgi:hypothetical protein